MRTSSELGSTGHKVIYDDGISDDGMQFSLGNWRYWLLGAAAFFTIVAIIMTLVSAPPADETVKVSAAGFQLIRVILGLLCVGVVPAVFLVCAMISAADRSRRVLFGICSIAAVLLSFLFIADAAIVLAVNGTTSSRAARDEIFKQAFATIDGYSTKVDAAAKAFFDAGGEDPKTLIGIDTIGNRIAIANKWKAANAESVRLLENAEPTINEWFEKAGVTMFGKEDFWVGRDAREYVTALKDARKADDRLIPPIIEYLYVMRKQADHFGVAKDGTVFFNSEEELDAYRTARAKIAPFLKSYNEAAAHLDRVRARVNGAKNK
jgi:hypothetical protein